MNKGKIIQVMGPVVDVRFEDGVLQLFITQSTLNVLAKREKKKPWFVR